MDDREKVVRILELLEKTVGNLDWVQIRLESPKHCSDTITEIKKALEEIEKMTDIEKDNLEQGVSCSREKIRVLESIREILEK